MGNARASRIPNLPGSSGDFPAGALQGRELDNHRCTHCRNRGGTSSWTGRGSVCARGRESICARWILCFKGAFPQSRPGYKNRTARAGAESEHGIAVGKIGARGAQGNAIPFGGTVYRGSRERKSDAVWREEEFRQACELEEDGGVRKGMGKTRN